MSKIVAHHIHYKELHGYDEIVRMPISKHKKLHHQLRKAGKCNVPPEILGRISTLACHRKSLYLKQMTETRRTINFTEILMPHILLVESIEYNVKYGGVHITSFFQTTAKNKKLLYLEDAKP